MLMVSDEVKVHTSKFHCCLRCYQTGILSGGEHSSLQLLFICNNESFCDSLPVCHPHKDRQMVNLGLPSIDLHSTVVYLGFLGGVGVEDKILRILVILWRSPWDQVANVNHFHMTGLGQVC